MWPLLSFSLHTQLRTQQKRQRHCFFATCSIVAGWCQWSRAPRDGHVPGSHMSAPHDPAWAKRRIRILKAGRASLLSSPPLPSATGQGGSLSPLCQQPPTRALNLGVLLLPPLSHQPNHHGQNQAYIWESSTKSSKAHTAFEEPPELPCARPRCNTRQASFLLSVTQRLSQLPGKLLPWRCCTGHC